MGKRKIDAPASSKYKLAKMLGNRIRPILCGENMDLVLAKLYLLRPAWLAYLVCQHLVSLIRNDLSQMEGADPEMDQLCKDKHSAAVPCEVFAALLDPRSKLKFRELRSDKTDTKKENRPKFYDNGIYIQLDQLYKTTKKIVEKNSQAKAIEL